MHRNRSQIIITGSSLFVLALLMPFHCCAGEAEYVSLEPPVLLPNGNEFKRGSDRTVYAKTYYVDQRHPGASDENPGSRDKPFLTINKAAQVAGPGERVGVAWGVYRELIEPRLGAEGPASTMMEVAPPGTRRSSSGSLTLKPEWIKSI